MLAITNFVYFSLSCCHCSHQVDRAAAAAAAAAFVADILKTESKQQKGSDNEQATAT